MLTLRFVVAVGVLLASSMNVLAQTASNSPWEEYDKLIDSRKSVQALGTELLGDSVDLATGGLSFSATDISIPGNSKLPLALTRSYSVTSHKIGEQDDLPFADWDLDLPRISGTFAPNWPESRCTGTGVPLSVYIGQALFRHTDFWDGVKAHMPGGGPLLLAAADAPTPADGQTYRWITSGWTVLRCLGSGSLQAGAPGEGFLAITSDGTKYTFDRMAQFYEPSLHKKDPQSGVVRFLSRRVNVLYASKIEDRFGNTVTLTFTNAWNAPARVSRIDSSDGREITFTYNARGHVDTASDGVNTWQYGYNYPSGTRGTLVNVTQPDGKQWSIGFSEFSNANIRYQVTGSQEEPYRDCFNPGDVLEPTTATGMIAHPSGVTGTFTVGVVRHSRSNVPASCGEYTLPHNNPNDDVAFFPINWDAFALISKTLQGQALPLQAWSYKYGSTVSWFYPAGGGGHPVCSSTGCDLPICLSDSCAGIAVTTIAGSGGKWARYVFGNSYRYNEGKLLRVEEGEGPSAVLRVTEHDYQLAQSGQVFPTPIGRGVHPRADWFTSAYLRPERAQRISQDGVVFTRVVDAFDQFARPVKVTKSR